MYIGKFIFWADASASDIIEWWYHETYNIQDVVHSIKKPGPWFLTDETLIDRTGYYDELNVIIKTVHSAHGRCYSIYFNDTLKSEHEFYSLRVKLVLVPEITFYVHERYNEVGAIFSYWPLDPITFTVKAAEQHTVTFQNDYYTPRIAQDMPPCIKDDIYSYPRCVTEWAKKKYIDAFVEQNVTCK